MVRQTTAVEADIPELLPIVRALARGGVSELLGGIDALSPIGVRTLKKRLSQLLNDATSGHPTVVEAGRGGSVLLVGTDALADALMALERSREMTFGAALDALPHDPSELPPLSLKGALPTLQLEKADTREVN